MLKVGVVGSRRRNEISDYELVKEKLQDIISKKGEIVLVSGGCSKGADSFVNKLSNELSLPKPIIFYADWKRHGRGAGMERNTYIARESDVLVAVVAPDRKGGTEDTIRKFKKLHEENELIIL